MKGFLLISIYFLFSSTVQADWKVDFSRRTEAVRAADLRSPASETSNQEPGFFDFLFQSGEPIQEIVILNTEKGFVPSTLRVREGLSYKIYVVNVNDSAKNVSFVLDSFSEHHATYYGKIKAFHIKPAKEGVFSFISPETSAKGRLVVYPAAQQEVRLPASGE